MIDYMYSDPHFGHRKLAEVRGYCEKGCSDEEAKDAVAKMNGNLIEGYNSHVCRDQTCLWVGDAFLMSFIEAEKIMQRLNGIKYLVLGNHDRSAVRMAKLGFKLVCNELILSICDRVVRVNHYPHWAPNRKLDQRHFDNLSQERVAELKSRYTQKRKGELLIHGHIHGDEIVYQNMINVSADAWNLRPVRWSTIESIVVNMGR